MQNSRVVCDVKRDFRGYKVGILDTHRALAKTSAQAKASAEKSGQFDAATSLGREAHFRRAQVAS